MSGDQKTLTEESKKNFRRNDLAVERRKRKLSVKRVARIIGVAERTVQAYERGKYMPSLRVALKLQILYRGQVASFYQPLYWKLTKEIRAAEQRALPKRGAV